MRLKNRYKFLYKKVYLSKRIKSYILKVNRKSKKTNIKEPLQNNDYGSNFEYIVNHRVKFTPKIPGGKFDSFRYVAKPDKPIHSIGCRGPPILIFALIQNQNLEENYMFNDKSPYTIRIEVIDDVRHYFVSFVNGENRFCEIEVPRSIFIEIHNSKKNIRNLTRSDERHIEIFELSDETLYNRALHSQKDVEEIISDIELSNILRKAIDNLSKTQKRRFILYYDFGHTYEQIATKEGCSFQAVGKSIELAEEKIKTFLKKRVEK